MQGQGQANDNYLLQMYTVPSPGRTAYSAFIKSRICNKNVSFCAWTGKFCKLFWFCGCCCLYTSVETLTSPLQAGHQRTSMEFTNKLKVCMLNDPFSQFLFFFFSFWKKKNYNTSNWGVPCPLTLGDRIRFTVICPLVCMSCSDYIHKSSVLSLSHFFSTVPDHSSRPWYLIISDYLFFVCFMHKRKWY